MTKNAPHLRKAASSASFYHRSQEPRMSFEGALPSHIPITSALFDQPIPDRTLFSGANGVSQRPPAPPVPPKVRETRSKGAAKDVKAEEYAQPFCDFLKQNPTVFHTVEAFSKDLELAGFKKLSARDSWELEKGGKYYTSRNGSSLIAFVVGDDYEPGNGAAIVAGHIDALTAKLKPIPKLPNKAGFMQMGVAPYAGGLNNTWWDRDLGIAGRVLVKEEGKIVQKLIKLDWPIAKIPTLAPHFGAISAGPFNKETQMVPVIGVDNADAEEAVEAGWKMTTLGGQGTFASTQPEKLVKVVSKELGISDYSNIVSWELELYDVQPATLAGLEKDLISAGRIDDKICSWAALQGLLNDTAHSGTKNSSVIKATAFFDDEEIGSLLRQGARGNFLPVTLERITDSFRAAAHPGDSSSRHSIPYGPDCLPVTQSSPWATRAAGLPDNIPARYSAHHGSGYAPLMPQFPQASSLPGPRGAPGTSALLAQMYANSFLVSSDVTHAVNPNFLGAYLPNHAPRLNVGVAVSADSNGHMTTDAVSTALFQRATSLGEAELQVFQIRNDVRSGGTVGPMLSSAMGMRAIDAGIPQLSMHSIRATVGSLDPGLGVKCFQAFLENYEKVDQEFRA